MVKMQAAFYVSRLSSLNLVILLICIAILLGRLWPCWLSCTAQDNTLRGAQDGPCAALSMDTRHHECFHELYGVCSSRSFRKSLLSSQLLI